MAPLDSTAVRFVTSTGIEVPAVTAEQMRKIDEVATGDTGPNLYQMMENAGRTMALLTLELLGARWRSARVIVLAGPGGNGGGGICAARHLANRSIDVTLCLSDLARLTEVTSFQRKVYLSTAGREVSCHQLDDRPYDIVIDALIGYGLHFAPAEPIANLIRWCNQATAPILSLDVPSGIDATTGTTLGSFIHPKWTMTLALPKVGLVSPLTGDLFLSDIGLPHAVFRRLDLEYGDPFGKSLWIPLNRHMVASG